MDFTFEVVDVESLTFFSTIEKIATRNGNIQKSYMTYISTL